MAFQRLECVRALLLAVAQADQRPLISHEQLLFPSKYNPCSITET